MNVEVNDVKQVLGEWYDDLPTTAELTSDERRDIERRYKALAETNRELYKQIPIPVVWQSDDPYENYEDMARTVGKEQVLRVFEGGSDPDFMSHEENIMGRAVHDWYGHLQYDVDFSMRGEYLKWYNMIHHYPTNVAPLLFTEVVGQRAAASYYEDGFTDDRFVQKPAPAPQHIRTFARKVLQ